MKNKRLILLIIGVFIIFSLNSFAETKKLRRIGLYTLCKVRGDIPTAEVMKSIVDRYTGDIKYGLDLAGYGDLYLPFIEQIKAAAFVEKSLPIGDKMIWMLYRSRGRVKVVQDIEWAGKKPLDVFSFTVKKDYKIYEFIMPKPCGNVALRKVEGFISDAICDIKVSPSKANVNDPITVDMSGSKEAKSLEVEVIDAQGKRVASKKLSPESPKWQTSLAKPGNYTFKGKAVNLEGKASTNPCQAKVYINFPPVCDLAVSAGAVEVGEPVTIDASGSSDPDGQVVRANFEIMDEAGNVADRYSISQKPFTWEKVFENPGSYSVTVVVTDDFGGVSEPCRARIDVALKKFFILAGANKIWVRGSYGSYVAPSLGFLYRVVPGTLDLVLAGGGAINLRGDPWKSFFLADVTLNVNAGPAFFSGGVGFNSKVKEERDSDFELIGGAGFNMLKGNSPFAAIFGQVRVPVGSGRTFSDHHKFVIGFRFFF